MSLVPPFNLIFFLNPTQLDFIKLAKINYLVWNAQFKHILKSYNLLSCIDGFKNCSTMFVDDDDDDDDAKNKFMNLAYTSCQSCDQFLLSWIISFIFPLLVAFLYGLDMSFLV
jgi:hypothetical protein